jgi:hypothetical protein
MTAQAPGWLADALGRLASQAGRRHRHAAGLAEPLMALAPQSSAG